MTSCARKFSWRRATVCTKRRCRSQQDKVPLYGAALQCRVTTEDPANNFAPDYGKISTYRSPAGFGIRLDGGTAYAGAVLAAYYDSLLVKVTAWGANLPEACQRMDRALREFRIRGVKTNIPFVENVVNHPKFRAGEVTTSFLDDSPELFRFRTRGDRATKLLSYLGDVILNGNPEVKGKQARRIRIAIPLIPATPAIDTPPARANCCKNSAPKKFAAWAKKEKRLLITDTTFRDAHQSLMATRVRTYDLLATAPAVARALPNLFSLEMWGGATFDTSLRFLHEDPWQRLRELRALRSQHLLPDASARRQRRRLRLLSRQRHHRIRSRIARTGHRHFPHLRFAQFHRQHARGHRRRARNRRGLRSRPSATPATFSTTPARNIR